MFAQRFLQTGAATLVCGAAAFTAPRLSNESKKRNFYDEPEDVSVVVVPGTVKPASPAEEQQLAPPKIVSGVTVRTTPTLESYAKSARKFTVGLLDSATDRINGWLNDYNAVEEQVATTVAELRSPQEDLLPGAIYVLTAALSGSIVARRRGLLIRGAAPLFFGLAAFRYFLPATFGNTSAFVWKLEQKAPVVAETHQKVYDAVESAEEEVEFIYNTSVSHMEMTVGKVRKFISKKTGLKIDEEK